MTTASGQLLDLLEGGADVADGSHPDKARVSLLTHACQTATRAERALGDADPELVVVALIHDAARIIAPAHHGAVMGAMARDRLSPRAVVLLAGHSRYQAAEFAVLHGESPPMAVAWTTAAALGRWDALSTDPEYPTEPLAHFADLVRRVWGD